MQIEVLATATQFVADGIHPDTRRALHMNERLTRRHADRRSADRHRGRAARHAEEAERLLREQAPSRRKAPRRPSTDPAKGAATSSATSTGGARQYRALGAAGLS